MLTVILYSKMMGSNSLKAMMMHEILKAFLRWNIRMSFTFWDSITFWDEKLKDIISRRVLSRLIENRLTNRAHHARMKSIVR